MTTKLLEIRDSMTRISVLAIRFDPADHVERAILHQNGYGGTIDGQSRYIAVMRLNGGTLEARLDPYDWGTTARTMHLAHNAIVKRFDELQSGDVVDVEFEQGWSHEKKTPEWKRYLA